jgi:hypothetical protein
MSNKFDELAQRLAQPGTRRQALKRFGAGIAGMALACFGLASGAEASKPGVCLPLGDKCKQDSDCCSGVCCGPGGQGKRLECVTNALVCF